MSNFIFINICTIFFYFLIQCEISESLPSLNEQIATKNISKEAGYFWQLTDIHWDFDYSETGNAKKMCHQVNDSNVEKLGKFGNYLCDSPWSLVESTLLAMKSFNGQPDFILWTGDNAPHTDLAVFPVIFEALRNVTDELLTLFGTAVAIIPVLGNHDTFPKDDFPETNEAFYSKFLENGNWKSIIPSDGIDNFKRGGYFKYKLNQDLSVLVLNTNLYYGANSMGKNVSDPSNQFEWMKKQFQEAKETSHKLIVTAHAPPGYWERLAKSPFLNATYNDVFVDILNEFGDVIIAQIYGHLHTDSFRIFGSSHENLKSVAFIAPSVTPFYPTRLVGGTGINPSIRQYTYNKSVIIDYVQYHINLTEANNFKKVDKACSEGISDDCSGTLDAPWITYYRATELFGVNSLGVNDMAAVYGKLHANDTYFQQYYTKNSGGYDQSHCNATCRRNYLCVVAHLKIDSVPKCVKQTGMESLHTIAPQSSYHIFPEMESEKQDGATSFSFNSFMTATVTLTATLSAVILIVGVMLLVISVRRKRILNSGSKLSEFEWVSRHNGYKPLSVDAE